MSQSISISEYRAALEQQQQNNPNFKNTSQPRLGLELWQIFSGLTIILTIASSLMWFSSLAPHSKKIEFVYIDTAKSTAFASMDAVRSQFENNKDISPLSGTATGYCYDNVADMQLDNERFSLVSQSFIDAQSQIEDVRFEMDSTLSVYKQDAFLLQNVVNETESYKNTVRDFFSTRYTLYSARQEIQAQATQVCGASFEELGDKLDDFDNVMMKYEEEFKLEPEWYAQTKVWSNSLRSFASDYPERETNEEDIDQVKSGFQSVFELKFLGTFDPLLDAISKQEEVFFNAIAELETWQQSEVLETETLENLIVLLSPDSNPKL